MNILTPTVQQLRWQRQEFGLFCHFGINTFYGRQWSDSTFDPKGFAPTHFDAVQWVDAAQRAGCKYLVLTARHHDGFCLWPTRTTAYSVSNSAFPTDVVGEVQRACERAGLPFGLSLSLAACYSDARAYDEFYARQLEEICTSYGELFEIRFDGAGSEGRVYDWNRWMEIVDRHQPQAMVLNLGRPTIRRSDNEDGLADDPNPYVVRELTTSAFAASPMPLDGCYLPPECAVAMRRNCFWQPDDRATLKSLEHLLGIWYRSVGRGANLLLNCGPNRAGLLDAPDVSRLLELHHAIEARFANPLASTLSRQNGVTTLNFGREAPCDHLVLSEAIEHGQRIFGYRVTDEKANLVCEGHTIGQKKIHAFATVRPRCLQVHLGENCLAGAQIESATAYLTGHENLPLPVSPLDDAAGAQKNAKP